MKFFRFIIIPFLFIGINLSCGKKSYEEEIIGKWVAIENNCDEKGRCKSSENVEGSNEYTKDGKLIVGKEIPGTYSIKNNIIFFRITLKDNILEGRSEVIYIRGNELLMKTTIAKSKPFIVKYRRSN